MASRGGEMGSLLILSATGEGDRGALGGRCGPELGTDKCVNDLADRVTSDALVTSSVET